MNLIIVGNIIVILSPIITTFIMIRLSKEQEKHLDLYEEYEGQIRDIFTLGFVLIPVLGLGITLWGMKCLNMLD